MLCPGCGLKTVTMDDICCDQCWERAPLRLKAKLNVTRRRGNWVRYLKAEQKLRDWLAAHYDPHFESQPYP